MVDALDDPTAQRLAVTPRPQARDHILPHPVGGDEPGRRTAATLGALDILPVRLGDGMPSRRVIEARGETVEEPLNRLIRYGRHRHEGGMRTVHRGGGQAI